MINKLLWAVFGLCLTGALVLFGLSWGRYVAPGTSVDPRAALTMTVLAGSILVYPITGILRGSRRR